MPTRKPSAGMRDQMVVWLQKKGFSFRQSRQIVKSIFDTITTAFAG
jgi:hypothetical protein